MGTPSISRMEGGSRIGGAIQQPNTTMGGGGGGGGGVQDGVKGHPGWGRGCHSIAEYNYDGWGRGGGILSIFGFVRGGGGLLSFQLTQQVGTMGAHVSSHTEYLNFYYSVVRGEGGGHSVLKGGGEWHATPPLGDAHAHD